MQAMFIRHNIDSTPAVLTQLVDESLIALHYGNSSSTHPDDYNRQGKKAIGKLWKFCESGAIVGADFREIKHNSIVVGVITPGSRVFARCFVDPKTKREFTYKVVQLHNAREVSFLNYPLLAAIQPRQTAITHWPKAQKCLEAITNGSLLPPCVESLDPSQLEVLCHEFMRGKGLLSALLLPIGRSMVDIDIVGIDESDERVFAQVTHSANQRVVQDKMKRLKEYAAPTVKLILFGPTPARVTDSTVEFISIQDVFTSIWEDKNSIQHKMLMRMLGRTPDSEKQT